MKKSYKRLLSVALLFLLAASVATGCAETRDNLVYKPIGGGGKRLEKPVTGALIPLVDMREQTKAYPKQVIMQTDYSGNVSYDINDRTPAEVINGAASRELAGLGVQLVNADGVEGPLDKENAVRIKTQLAALDPGVKVAFGGKIKEFMATSQRKTLTTDVHVAASLQFYVLDLETGDLLWSDYKTEWDDVKASADHNYLIDQLDQAIVNLMQKSILDNESMKALLVKISNRR